MTPLTERQELIFAFIRGYIAEKKYSPSMREIADMFGITIKGAYDHINAIEKKGYISRHRGISRSITITEVSR